MDFQQREVRTVADLGERLLLIGARLILCIKEEMTEERKSRHGKTKQNHSPPPLVQGLNLSLKKAVFSENGSASSDFHSI